MIKILHHSGIHTLKAYQKLPVSKKEAWSFLSSPINLNRITPDYMKLSVTSDTVGEKMFPGQIITYDMTPVPHLRMSWVTEITQVEEERFFVDEQRYGPYSLWHHEHWLREIPGGTAMIDRVSYKLPLGMLGRWAEKAYVRKQLKKIFLYRAGKLEELFGVYPDYSPAAE
ncbi:MAG: SRPBCC family protein [Cytophagales bacterium]|nr:SRPBCC family protein [Cytophagales bacterium]